MNGTAAPPAAGFAFRRAAPADATCVGVLAMQVFLDTYATRGIDADLAHEALSVCAPAAYEARLRDDDVDIALVEHEGRLVAFADVSRRSACPQPGVVGPEVLRLYVQAPFQRLGLGCALLARVEDAARALGAPHVWLTAWAGNVAALAFYPRVGYVDVGSTPYVICGRSYENRIFAKRLEPT